MYTLNCYLNFVPIQERSDWFEHWSTKGVKPLLLVEYGAPHIPTFSNSREAGGPSRANTLWFPAEWGAQFRGDAAYQLPENEKEKAELADCQLREHRRRAGIVHRAELAGVPHLGRHAVQQLGRPLHDVHGPAGRDQCNLHGGLGEPSEAGLQPRFQPGRAAGTSAIEDSDWTPNREGEALIRYNQPVLAYIAGKAARFTSQDHNFNAGETVEKQVIVINNSRQNGFDCDLHLVAGRRPKTPTANGRTERLTRRSPWRRASRRRIPVRLTLPRDLGAGQLHACDDGEVEHGRDAERHLRHRRAAGGPETGRGGEGRRLRPEGRDQEAALGVGRAV